MASTQMLAANSPELTYLPRADWDEVGQWHPIQGDAAPYEMGTNVKSAYVDLSFEGWCARLFLYEATTR